MPGGGCPTCRADLPPGLRRGLPNCRASDRPPGKPQACPASGFPVREEEVNRGLSAAHSGHHRFGRGTGMHRRVRRIRAASWRAPESDAIEFIAVNRKENPMSLKIRLARGGTKKRPHYHIVVADSRSPRDGRFIEKLGYFNPMLPKDKAERVKLDVEKAKAWIAKGAQPTDRVARFLDAAGVDEARSPQQPGEGECRQEAQGAAPKPPPRRPKQRPLPPRTSRGAASVRASRHRGVRRDGSSLMADEAHPRRPDRRAARRARRGAAEVLHRGPAGDRRLRAAAHAGRHVAASSWRARARSRMTSGRAR